MAPLLSVCVPTYNRAHLLRLSLQAALPQVAKHADLVELCVSDNASTDMTKEVVEECRSLGPLRYYRNQTNLGFAGNIVNLATKHATGDYVWLIGDDDLINQGAVQKILDVLQAHQDINALYANFNIARYPDHWPVDAIGGYKGQFIRSYVNATGSRLLETWKNLLSHQSELCTAMFSHIVQRRVWVSYWEHRSVPRLGLTMRAVFPHCVMFAHTLMNEPVYCIGEPALTAFTVTNSYSDNLNPIWLFCYPRLLRLYIRKGLAGRQREECVRDILQACVTRLNQRLGDPSTSAWGTMFRFLLGTWRYPVAWKMLARAVRLAGRPYAIDVLLGVVGKVNRWIPIVDLWKC